MSREFANLQAGVSAPIVDWLRVLATHLSGQHQQAKVGAIGMRPTGAFVIPLILERCVTAPVAAQPGRPVFPVSFRAIGIGRGPWMKQLNVSDTDVEQAVVRLSWVATISRCWPDGSRRTASAPPSVSTAYRGSSRTGSFAANCLVDRSSNPPHATLTTGYEEASDDPATSHPPVV